MATIAEAAAHVDLKPDRFEELQALGVIPRTAVHGGLDLDQCRVAYIRHLRAGKSGRGIQGGGEEGYLELSAERARLAKEQADSQAMKNALLRRDLLPRDEVTAAVQVAFSRVKARLLAIPTKAAPSVIRMRELPTIKARLTELVHEALAELSSIDIEAQSSVHDRDEDVGDSGTENGQGGKGLVQGSAAAAVADR